MKNRYNDVLKEVGKRIKWDFEFENDEYNDIGNENKNKNENENEYDEEHSRTKNRALAITHSLLSSYPQLLYE